MTYWQQLGVPYKNVQDGSVSWGQGANFAFYNGRLIDQRIATLGYILGDEGSGAYMGKKLLTDFTQNYKTIAESSKLFA